MKTKWLIVFCVFLFDITVPMSGPAEESIKIALIFSKTGTAVSHNLEYFPWINFLIEHINKQGGVLGRPVKIIELDNNSTPLGSKKAALEAIRQNVAAVIGPSWSSHALATASILQEAGIPMITAIATNPKVTLIGDCIFRVCFTDPFQGKVMVGFAIRELKAKTAVVLTNVTHDYCMGLADSFIQAAGKNGLAMLWEGKYRDSDIDFADLLGQVRSLKPDVIFVPGYERDSGFIINQARQMGISSIFLGGDGWGDKMYEYSRNANVDSYFSSHWHPQVSFSAGKDIQLAYCKKYDKKPSVDLALGYDAVMILVNAIRRAGSIEHEKIKQALSETKNFHGATGTITFDKHGDPENKDAVILKFDTNKVVFVKNIKPKE